MSESERSSILRSTTVQTDRTSVWAEHIASFFVALDFATDSERTFSGRMETVPAPRASATLIEASEHRVMRTPELIGKDKQSRYKIGLQLAGTGVLSQDNREAQLLPGDLVVYDTSRPYLLAYPREMASLVMLVTPQSLGISENQMRELTAVRLPSDSVLTQLVSPLLEQVARRPRLFGSGTQGRLASNAVDLLATVFRTALDIRAVQREDEAELLKSRIMSFIEAHIRDPQLNAKMIADAHFMSVRSLYALFEDADLSVAQTIRAQRLEGAMRDLTDPAKLAMPIAGIAASWSFMDAANFARAFKAHFGLSPRQARALITG